MEAYAAGLAYRLTRFALRNRVLVVMAAVLIGALALSSVAITIFAFRADAARRHADVRRGQAESLIEFMVGNLQGKLKELGRLDVLDEVGDEALKYFASVPEGELSEQELLKRSQMLYQIGEVRVRQGKLNEAQAPMQESLALAQRLSELRPDDGERLFAVAQSHFWIGFVHWKQGDSARALRAFQSYLEVARHLTRLDPDRLDWRLEVAYAHNNLASVYEKQAQYEEAQRHLLYSMDIRESLVAKDPDKPEWLKSLAASKLSLALTARAMGRLDFAEQLLVGCVALRQALSERFPENAGLRRPLAIAHSHLGNLLLARGRLEQAAEHLTEARNIFSELSAVDPSNSDFKRQLLIGEHQMAVLRWMSKDRLAAERAWAELLPVIDSYLMDDPDSRSWRHLKAVILFHGALARSQTDPGYSYRRAEEAASFFHALQELNPDDNKLQTWLARTHLVLGKTSEPAHADDHFEKVLGTLDPFVEGSSNGSVLAPWAEAMLHLGRHDEARPALETLSELSYQGLGFDRLCREAGISCLGDQRR